MSNNFDILEALWLRKEKKRREQKIIEGAPPLTYTAKKAGTLTDYRIYGQTVDGESVGDRTGNLFDGEVELGSWDINTQPCSKIDAYIDAYNVRIRNANFIKVAEKSTYSVTMSTEENVMLLIHFLDAQRNYISETTWINNISNFNTPSQCEYINIIFKKGNNETIALSDIFNIMLNSGSTPLPYEPYGYKVPVTVEGKNLVTSYLVEPNGGIQFFPAVYVEVNLQPNTEYLITFTVHENGVKLYSNDLLFTSIYYSSETQGKKTMRLKTKANIQPDQHINNKGWVLLRNAKQNPSDFTITDVKIQLVSDAPITTPIYLPEQIRKVGNEAEYIDYAEQKQHFVGGTSVDVTLPALPTIAGTNTLSVGTGVQPSKVMVRGKLKE